MSKINAPNTYMALLAVTSLKMLKCNSTMNDAADAFLKADKMLTDGAYEEAIANAFKRRGVETSSIYSQMPSQVHLVVS